MSNERRSCAKHRSNLRAEHVWLVAWHTLPIVAYYHEKQGDADNTAAMLDSLLTMLEVPSVFHRDAATWRTHGIADFEDALQFACAVAGGAEIIITRNTADFEGSAIPAMTPERFLEETGSGEENEMNSQ